MPVVWAFRIHPTYPLRVVKGVLKEEPSHWVMASHSAPCSVPVPSPDKMGGLRVRKGIRRIKHPASKNMSCLLKEWPLVPGSP